MEIHFVNSFAYVLLGPHPSYFFWRGHSSRRRLWWGQHRVGPDCPSGIETAWLWVWTLLWAAWAETHCCLDLPSPPQESCCSPPGQDRGGGEKITWFFLSCVAVCPLALARKLELWCQRQMAVAESWLSMVGMLEAFSQAPVPEMGQLPLSAGWLFAALWPMCSNSPSPACSLKPFYCSCWVDSGCPQRCSFPMAQEKPFCILSPAQLYNIDQSTRSRYSVLLSPGWLPGDSGWLRSHQTWVHRVLLRKGQFLKHSMKFPWHYKLQFLNNMLGFFFVVLVF